jgi:hypothetical protein
VLIWGGCNCNNLRAISKPDGTTVVWEWEVATSHAATSDTGVWDSGILSGVGMIFSRTFSSPGVFPYHCRLYDGPEEAGMSVLKGKGRIFFFTWTRRIVAGQWIWDNSLR